MNVDGRPVVMTDIAISPTGALYGVDGFSTTNSSLYRINPFNANATLVGGLGTNVNSLVFGLDGKLYAANNELWTINTASGAAHEIGNAGSTYISDGDLAFLHGNLYLTGCTKAPIDCGTTHLIGLDPSSGAGVDLGDTTFNQMFGLAANDVTLFALSGDVTANADKFLYTINPATGNATQSVAFGGDSIGPIYGAALAPVPEARVSVLMLAGLIVLSAAARAPPRLRMGAPARLQRGVSGAPRPRPSSSATWRRWNSWEDGAAAEFGG
jgi:hypothetical protein